MCTVTWLHEPDGYRLWFNRDERHERGPERPPAAFERDGRLVIAPTDGDFGGTWLAVNELGLCVMLVNGYPCVNDALPERPISRGLLVRELSASADAAEVLGALARYDLERFAPFLVLAVEARADSTTLRERTARWNGRRLVTRDARPPVVSSGHDQRGARRVRRALFERVVRDHGGRTPAALEEFQRSHLDHGTDPHSPCLHGLESSTRSQCRVRVTRDEVALEHVPGPPCVTAPTGPLRLRRTRR